MSIARIPKGTRVWGTFKGSPKTQGVTRTVELWTIDLYDHQPPQVCWVGSGGYWHYANLDDVELEPVVDTHKPQEGVQ